jgi:hypothetical protein
MQLSKMRRFELINGDGQQNSTSAIETNPLDGGGRGEGVW